MIRLSKFIIVLILIIGGSETQAQFSFEVAFPNLTFSNPVDLQNAGDGTNRIFVVEQSGIIKVFENNPSQNSTRVFLDIRDRLTSGGETGLLGLAFHPDYENNGYFYVNYTAPNPLRTVISRFNVSTTNPDSADKNSELILLSYDQPYANHNGGQVAFGPDGYLYISSGDGGSGGDPQNNAQNVKNLLGKILRIDVNNPSGGLNYSIPPDNPFVDSTGSVKKEIYAWGLRNPWRMSFDFVSGWLWTGDVGQGAREEINIIQNGKNYGWKCYEGNLEYNTSGCLPSSNYVFPIWDYPRSEGISVTGGYVYRGLNVPELYGKYIYGDYGSKKIWALEYDGINAATNQLLLTASGNVISFGLDQNQELYMTSFDGKIYRFTPTTTGVNEEIVVRDFSLFQNYPNPFNPTTSIKFALPERSKATLTVFNALGSEIAVLKDETLSQGIHNITWNATDFSSGVYFVRITAESLSSNKTFLETIKIVLIK